MDAAKRFFARSLEVAGHAPNEATTDGHDAYPHAIRETAGGQAEHRSSRYLNDRLELDIPRRVGRCNPGGSACGGA